MSFIVDSLRGQLIQDVLVDSEVTYIMLINGTQITIKGLIVVEPKPVSIEECAAGMKSPHQSSLPHLRFGDKSPASSP